MEGFRSRSTHGDGRRMASYGGSSLSHVPAPFPGMFELRSYSVSYAAPATKEASQKKLKEAPSFMSGWRLSNPELKRMKKFACYKVYSMESKVKGSLRKSFRWMKNGYTHLI